VPDLTVGAGVRYVEEIDDTAFVLGLSVPLPVFDRNQGGTRAARLRAIRAGHLERSSLVEVRTSIAEAHARIVSSVAEVRSLRDEVVPSAAAVFEAGEEAFRLGKIGSLELLDAQRTLFDSRRRLVDALVRYHLAVLAAERLIGAPLTDAGTTKGEDS
jgi:cobalt-zinc-cadmium efflux system outer membrane protein